MKASFLGTLSELADPFTMNAGQVEMKMTGMEDSELEKIFGDLNDWQQENDPEWSTDRNGGRDRVEWIYKEAKLRSCCCNTALIDIFSLNVSIK